MKRVVYISLLVFTFSLGFVLGSSRERGSTGREKQDANLTPRGTEMTREVAVDREEVSLQTGETTKIEEAKKSGQKSNFLTSGKSAEREGGRVLGRSPAYFPSRPSLSTQENALEIPPVHEDPSYLQSESQPEIYDFGRDREITLPSRQQLMDELIFTLWHHAGLSQEEIMQIVDASFPISGSPLDPLEARPEALGSDISN